MINKQLVRPKIMSDAFSKNMEGKCIICGRKDRIYAKGMCMYCYQRNNSGKKGFEGK